MTMIDYTETVLPELAYLVAQRGDPGLLNAAADFSSYFERDQVLRCGSDVHAARISAEGTGELDTTDRVCVVGSLIACSATAFVVKSSAIAEVTTMYFSAAAGVAEVDLLFGRTVVAAHPSSTSVGSLLERHLGGDPDMVLLRRQHSDGGRLHLALSHGRHAYSDDGVAWLEGDEPADQVEVLRRFVDE